MTSAVPDGAARSARQPRLPGAGEVVAFAKPVTWFPPMWAFLCGAVASGAPLGSAWLLVPVGMLLAGPLVCGTGQMVNDWYDRHVDAINEPDRPIPSGRIPGAVGLWLGVAGTLVSAAVAATLGPWVLSATIVGLAIAWAYSAPPVRLKANGWTGPAACALAYEGLPWFTGAALLLGALPSGPVIAIGALYAAGAFGIMTLNDFKAIRGDRALGIASLPVTLGPRRAGLVACGVMIAAQLAVVALLAWLGLVVAAAAIAAFTLAQAAAMRRLLADPAAHAPWYNAVGVSLYVAGMLVAAFGLRGLP